MFTRTLFPIAAAATFLTLVTTGLPRASAGPGGKLKLDVIDRETKQPLACRMHLTNAAKKPLKAPQVPFWHDHFTFSGSITLKLPKGEYAFEIEHGPEYLVRLGHFSMDDFSEDTKVVDLKRFVDMAAEGWWSGDLDVQRPLKDLELLMEAEDLHVAELVTWPNRKSLLAKTKPATDPLIQFDKNHFIHTAAGSDERAGGLLLFYNLQTPLDLADTTPEFPPQLDAIRAAHEQQGAWVDAARAYGWDVPVWIAAGQLDSIQLANSNLRRKTAHNSEGNGYKRDPSKYPEPSGNGRWSEAIYYHLLNCGLRMPPTAGSGSGVVANPPGYNRVYVHVDGELTYEKWCESLRRGQVVVTNGPLIRPEVEGELPGHVFQAAAGQEVELEIGLKLSTRDRVTYLEIIKDGETAHQVRLDDWAATGGKLPLLRFDRSGWFVIRAVTDVPETYRFATTAPYYVEIGGQPKISKASAQFFLDWMNERAKSIRLDDPKQRKVVLKDHTAARAYWQGLVDKANAE